jgi:hypothetical protein
MDINTQWALNNRGRKHHQQQQQQRQATSDDAMAKVVME